MKRLLVACIGVFALDARLRAQAPVMGQEFVVHATPEDRQVYPAVANLGPGGDFLVIWNSSEQLPDANLFGRRFSSAGVPLDETDFAINEGPSSWKFLPRVASNESGDFVVTWTEVVPPEEELAWEVRARRFDASGAPVGDDILVNQYTTDSQGTSSVAMNPDGSFFVVWRSGGYYVANSQDGSGYGVFGRRFDSDGQPLGDEFQLHQYTTGDQDAPRIVRKPNGNFLVVWVGAFAPWAGGGGNGIVAREFDNAGVPLGGEFQVDTPGLPNYIPHYLDVAVDSAGKAIVVWEDIEFHSFDFDVRAQRLDASGNKLGPEFPVSEDPDDTELRPRVAVGPDGDFVIAWWNGGPSASRTISAQHFDATGRRRGDVVQVHSEPYGKEPAITAQPNGQFVVAWTKNSGGYQDDVRARLMGFPGVGPIRVDVPHAVGTSVRSGSSNLNGVLEVGEQVAVKPAFRNSSNAALALSGTASNLQGPAGPAYTLVDAAADYGTIEQGESSNCFDATGDCFVVGVSGARPAPHWDATFDETLSYNGFTRKATLHIGESFADVPVGHPFYALIENLFHNGVTGGCAGGGYCPADGVTRAQMAVFLLKARWGAEFVPEPATGTVFSDVPAVDPFAPWIEELARQGVTGGCGGGLYCPESTVTRQQMAVFVVKALEGSAYDPPDCVGIFDDVPCTPGAGFSDWIEEFANRGITGGCSLTPPLYCPTNANNRGQMAVFLVKTFGLALYGG